MLKNLALLLSLTLAIPLAADPRQMNEWFHAAAAEFDVPVEVLQSVAFVESRWTHLTPAVTPSRPSTLLRAGSDGEGPRASRQARIHDHSERPASYGVMGLRDDDHFGHSLPYAAALLGRTPAELMRDPELNIRGAAALLEHTPPASVRTIPSKRGSPPSRV